MRVLSVGGVPRRLLAAHGSTDAAAGRQLLAVVSGDATVSGADDEPVDIATDPP